MSEDLVKWPRDALEIERIDEEAGVPDLAPSAATHESPKLLVGAATTPRRHLLKRPKAMEVTVGLENFFDSLRTERPDQLILQILVAHVEAELLQLGTREV
jgi:hypothetical protein